MLVRLGVRGIGASKHMSEKFAFTIIYISSIDKNGRKIYVCINRKLHLIDGLKANILIGNNVLCIKSFAINRSTSSTFIYNWDIKIDISAW